MYNIYNIYIYIYIYIHIYIYMYINRVYILPEDLPYNNYMLNRASCVCV